MICPVCKIMYGDDFSKEQMFDHITTCKGRKDIITTRWYRKDSYFKVKPVAKEIQIDVEFRPVTR